MPRSVVVIAMLTALTAGGVEEAAACSCMQPGPPCEAVWKADAVFAGTVRSVEEVNDGVRGAPHSMLLVTFMVERAFVGAEPGPLEITTAVHGAACGYPFVAGRQYLVYAHRTASSRLSAGLCSRTRAIEGAREDLQYLSALPSSGASARVFGRVTEWERHPAEEVAVDNGPVEGLVVNVRAGGLSRDAVTDRHGRYEISGLPVGPAILTALAPHGFDQRGLSIDLELRDPRACSEQNFEIGRAARAAGTLVDHGGRPLAGVFVDAVAAELAGHQPPAYQHPARTNDLGQFTFDALPPGSYVFGVSLTRQTAILTRRDPVYLPGTPLAREAVVIELAPGDAKDLGVLRLRER